MIWGCCVYLSSSVLSLVFSLRTAVTLLSFVPITIKHTYTLTVLIQMYLCVILMYTNKHSPTLCFAFASNRKQHSVDIQISQRQGYTVPKDFSVSKFYTRGTHIFILFLVRTPYFGYEKKVIFPNVSVCVASICRYLDLSFFYRSKIEQILSKSPVILGISGGGEDWFRFDFFGSTIRFDTEMLRRKNSCF